MIQINLRYHAKGFAREQGAIIVGFCLVFAYLFFFVPLKVCISLEILRITSIFGFQKKIIKWSEIKSLSISKTSDPSLPIQIIVRFDQGKGIKRQSFGLSEKSKLIGLIRVFKINNISILSNGHGLVDHYIKEANDESLD
jgi:hypothetical protein